MQSLLRKLALAEIGQINFSFSKAFSFFQDWQHTFVPIEIHLKFKDPAKKRYVSFDILHYFSLFVADMPSLAIFSVDLIYACMRTLFRSSSYSTNPTLHPLQPLKH